MTAKEVMSVVMKESASGAPLTTVESDMPVIEVLPRLLDSPEGKIGVAEDGINIGVIDRDSMLEGLGRMIAARDDCSVITVECLPEEYSASQLAHAVEDSDAHLVDLFTVPGREGRLIVTLRVRHRDPSAAVRSLERYDFNVVEARGSGSDNMNLELSAERLLALRTLMNV